MIVNALKKAGLKDTDVTLVNAKTNELPQVFAAQGSNVSNGASGTAQVNLRGLGANRTLVLMNGQRLASSHRDVMFDTRPAGDTK